MKEFKSYTDLPIWAEILCIPINYILMVLKILIYIPVVVISWINGQMKKYN